MEQIFWVLGLVVLAGVAYWLGLRAQRSVDLTPPPHRTVVVGVDGFCRLIRGWEWVAAAQDGGTVGITLRGVGGTTGMQLALVQVERELADGHRLPIAGDTVGHMLSVVQGNDVGAKVVAPLRPSRPYTGTEGIRLGNPVPLRIPRHDPLQPEPGAFDGD